MPARTRSALLRQARERIAAASGNREPENPIPQEVGETSRSREVAPNSNTVDPGVSPLQLELREYRARRKRMGAYIRALRLKLDQLHRFYRLEGTILVLEDLIVEGYFLAHWRMVRLLDEHKACKELVDQMDVPDLPKGDREPLRETAFPFVTDVWAYRACLTRLIRYVNFLESSGEAFRERHLLEGPCAFIEDMMSRGSGLPIERLEALQRVRDFCRIAVNELAVEEPLETDISGPAPVLRLQDRPER